MQAGIRIEPSIGPPKMHQTCNAYFTQYRNLQRKHSLHRKNTAEFIRIKDMRESNTYFN